MFCQLDALKRCRKKKALLETLESLPMTLVETYERIFTNIEKDYQKEARRALVWLAFSRRPLRVEELAEAAVIDPKLSPPFDPEERLHDPCNDIVEILGSLITVSSQSAFDDSSSDIYMSDWENDSESEQNGDLPGEEIRLAHFSVKEYFLSHRMGFQSVNVDGDCFLLDSCLVYILHYDKSDLKATFPKDLENFPLLQYSCSFWKTHAKSILTDRQIPIDSVIRRFFLSDTAFMTWHQLYRLNATRPTPLSSFKCSSLSLYYASRFGLELVVQQLLEHNADVNTKVKRGRTALHVAARGGYVAIAQLLLKHNADVNAKDRYGWTALHVAARRGHAAISQLLLKHNVNVKAANRFGRTALDLTGPNDRAMQLLLKAKADVEDEDWEESTAKVDTDI